MNRGELLIEVLESLRGKTLIKEIRITGKKNSKIKVDTDIKELITWRFLEKVKKEAKSGFSQFKIIGQNVLRNGKDFEISCDFKRALIKNVYETTFLDLQRFFLSKNITVQKAF